ncbi:hypothetical protein [Aeromicrobium sp.]|uniref:hypothetical protein n=1 Tax=Aeromicrobium sp. TaxID=1871063 RepID=UPI0028AFF216|nr:hypothetical protein [Aeromicrobium sp.]
MRVLPRLVLAPFMALVVLGACASPDDEPTTAPGAPVSESSSEDATAPEPVETPEPFRGLPDGAGEGFESPAGVVVGEDGLIHIVTYGSSSNPAIVRGAIADGQDITVDVSDVPDRPATMDFVPTTSAFFLPSGVDLSKPVTFVLGDLGTVRIDTVEPGAQAWVEPRD